jgi:hypothetical protein
MPNMANTIWYVAGSSGTADFSDGTALTGYRNIAAAAAAGSLVNGGVYTYRAEHPTDKSIWENGSGAVNTGTGVLARTTIAESSTGAKINFAVAPVIFFPGNMRRDWDGVVSYDLAQSPSASQKQTALKNIGVDQVTARGDADYTVLATDRFVATNAAFTAARNFVMPAANAVSAGAEVLISDLFGGVTSANTLTVARAGADTINGATGVTIYRAYGFVRLRSDGTSKWTIVGCSKVRVVTIYTSGSGTHSTLVGCTFMRVRGKAGGGGGAGTGSGATAGGNAGNTTFGAATANAGLGGSAEFSNLGGTASGATIHIRGAPGQAGCSSSSGFFAGGMGGGRGAGRGVAFAAGEAAAANSGAGGGGGGGSGFAGGGGSEGGEFEWLINGPSSSYSYAIGAGGSAGAAGTSGFAGGAGAAGQIIVEEDVA